MGDVSGRTKLFDGVTEKDLQSAVIKQMQLQGWLCYHTFDSRRSKAGFPDLTAVHGGRLIFVEFKSEKGGLTYEQIEWLNALADAAGEVYVVYPSTQDAFLENLALVGSNLETHWLNLRQHHE
jgi:hypothetical protein